MGITQSVGGYSSSSLQQDREEGQAETARYMLALERQERRHCTQEGPWENIR